MIKNYIKLGILGVIALAVLSMGILYNKKRVLAQELSIALANQKAADMENSTLKENNRVYQYTISQLTSYNDSLVRKMDSIRKVLNIKDKNLVSLQYLSSRISKIDTIIVNDTLFRDPTLSLDTVIGDPWYSTKLELKYPSFISIKPSFLSKKYIITSKKKETINPPKKFFLFRWFQKKHTILEVTVKEENPYIRNVDNKFIEIID